MADIDTITFDLWQTLIIDDRDLGRARTQRRLEGAMEALTDAGYDFSLDHLREAYRSCYRACRVIHQDEKDVTFDEQVNMFIDFHRRRPVPSVWTPDTVERINYWYAESFFDFPPSVDPEAYGVPGGAVQAGLQAGHDFQHGNDAGPPVPQVSGPAQPAGLLPGPHLLRRGEAVQAFSRDVPHDPGRPWDNPGEGRPPWRPHRQRRSTVATRPVCGLRCCGTRRARRG